PHVALDHFLQVALIERHLAVGERADALVIVVVAGDRGAEIGQAGRHHGCEIARAEYSNVHNASTLRGIAPLSGDAHDSWRALLVLPAPPNAHKSAKGHGTGHYLRGRTMYFGLELVL